MAIESANILRSLNSMLESKERRERFDVEASLMGMEVALKREQQRIGEEEFGREMELREDDLALREAEALGEIDGEPTIAAQRYALEKEAFRENQKAGFREEVGSLLEVTQAEKIKKSNMLWGGYFSGVHDRYFPQGGDGGHDYSKSKKKKLLNDIKDQIGPSNKTTANMIVNLIVEYGQTGDSIHMLKIAQIYGSKLGINPTTGKVTDPRFARGMMELGMLPSSAFDYKNVRKDFNDLIEYEVTSNKLTQELFDITQDDYVFNPEWFKNIAYEPPGTAKGRLTSEQEKELEKERFEDFDKDSVLQALQNIQRLEGEDRMKAIGEELGELPGLGVFGIAGYDADQGFMLEGGDREYKKDFVTGGTPQKQAFQLGQRRNKLWREMGLTTRAINDIKGEIEGQKRAESLVGIEYTGTDKANSDAIALASATLAAEAYSHQISIINDQIAKYEELPNVRTGYPGFIRTPHSPPAPPAQPTGNMEADRQRALDAFDAETPRLMKQYSDEGYGPKALENWQKKRAKQRKKLVRNR